METIEQLRAAIAATNPKPDAIVCADSELPATSIEGVQIYYCSIKASKYYSPLWVNPRNATRENYEAWWRVIHAARGKYES
jgi:hypothetical protein